MKLKDKFRYSNSIEKYVNPDSSILVIGCGNINLRYKNYIGLDIDLNLINKKESDRFLKYVQNLPNLKAKDLAGLNVEVNSAIKKKSKIIKGIF